MATTLTPAEQTTLNNTYRARVVNAMNTGKLTTAELDAIIADAKTAGAVIDKTVLSRATANATKNDAAAEKATQTALNKTYNTQVTNALNTGKLTTAELDRIVADAKAAGATIDSATLTKATTNAAKNDAANKTKADADAQAAAKAKADADAQAAAKAAATAEARAAADAQAAATAAAKAGAAFNADLLKATSQADLDAIRARAEAAGATLNQGYVDQAQQKITASANAIESKAAAEKLAAAQADWQRQASTAATPEQAQKIIDQARAAGQWNLNDAITNSYITEAQARVDTAARAEESAKIETARQAETASKQAASLQKAYDYASKLVPPTSIQNKFTQDGYQLVGIPDDPTTPDNEAGWYVNNAGQMQRVGEDGKPQGGPVAPDVLQASTDQIRTNTQAYELQQQAETARQADLLLAKNVTEFESKLPTPAEFMSSGRESNTLRGPDGSEYFLTPANSATGTAPEWVKMDQNMGGVTRLTSGQVQSTEDYNKEYTAVQEANRQFDYAQEAKRAAEMRRTNAGDSFKDFITSDFGKFMAIVAIAAVAAPYLGQLFSGAAAGEGAAAAGALAEGGASAAEIAAALESAGYSQAAASAMAETATGIAAGTIDAATVAASSSITPEMLAMANATADPIAALNASAGWTAADTAYLASIGAPASVISAAEASNVAMGYDPTGSLRILSDAETAELLGNVNPDYVNTLQPVEPPPYRVEVSGAAGTAEAPGYAIGESMTPGSQLATQAQIDAGAATWNPAANAWEINALKPLESIPLSSSPVVGIDLAAPALNEVAATATVLGVTPETVLALGGAAAAMALLGGGGSAAAGGAAAAGSGAAGSAAVPVTPAPVTPAPAAPQPLTPIEPVTPAPGTPPATTTPGTTVTTNPVTGMTETVTPGTGTSPVANVTLTPAPGPVAPAAGTATGAGVGAGEVLAGAAAAGTVASAAGAGAAAPPLTPLPQTPVATPPVTPVEVPPPVAPPPQSPLPQTPVATEPVTPVVVPPPVTPPPAGTNLPPVVDAVATPNPNYTNPPVPSLPEAIVDYGKAVAGGLSAADLAKIAAGWVIINGVLSPPAPVKREYGPIAPLDWSAGVPINTSGLNPGYITNVPRQYAPQGVRSQFYWGQKPYQPGTTFDPALYRSAPAAPAQPFGLQQMYNPQTQTIENLLQGVGEASATAPYNIPRAPRV